MDYEKGLSLTLIGPKVPYYLLRVMKHTVNLLSLFTSRNIKCICMVEQNRHSLLNFAKTN